MLISKKIIYTEAQQRYRIASISFPPARNYKYIQKKKNGITNSIDATLSVDSLFFHPIVSILDKMDISGMEISKEEKK